MKRVLVVVRGCKVTDNPVRGILLENVYRKHGIDVTFVAWKPFSLLKRLAFKPSYRRKVTAAVGYRLIRAFGGKVVNKYCDWNIARKAADYDTVLLLEINSPNLIRQIRAHSGARIVYDLCDAVWQPYYVGFDNIDETISIVDAVTNDNEYGMRFASRLNPSVFLWPSPSQVELFDQHRGQTKPSVHNGIITIGWVGSNSTMFNLYRIWEALELIFAKHKNVQLRLLGVDASTNQLPRFENVSFSAIPAYDSAVMVKEVLEMDIGLYPLFDTENARVRGILKALIYMSGEAAVVSSPVGDCIKIIKDGESGFLAGSSTEWVEKLDRLIVDRELRRRVTTRGLELVRQDYSLEKNFEFLREALKV